MPNMDSPGKAPVTIIQNEKATVLRAGKVSVLVDEDRLRVTDVKTGRELLDVSLVGA